RTSSATRGSDRSCARSPRSRRGRGARGGGARCWSRLPLLHLRLSRAGETVFPPRAPFFFWARLSQRAPRVGAQPEDLDPGNLPVPHNPLHAAFHAALASPGLTCSTAARKRPSSGPIPAAERFPGATTTPA